MVVEVYSLAYEFSEGSSTSAPFFSVFSARKWRGLGLEKQYILRIGLINEKIFVQFEVSNHSSDVQKLFSVIRDGSSNIIQLEKTNTIAWLVKSW